MGIFHLFLGLLPTYAILTNIQYVQIIANCYCEKIISS